MEAGLREVCRSVRIGKILIQRVRTTRFSSYQITEVNWIDIGRRNGSTKALLLQGGFWTGIVKTNPKVFPMQFPPDIANRYVLLLDPMLGALEFIGDI